MDSSSFVDERTDIYNADSFGEAVEIAKEKLYLPQSVREYFCYDCRQLRLCLDPIRINCGNCNSTNIVWGKAGELDKDKLLNSIPPDIDPDYEMAREAWIDEEKAKREES